MGGARRGGLDNETHGCKLRDTLEVGTDRSLTLIVDRKRLLRHNMGVQTMRTIDMKYAWRRREAPLWHVMLTKKVALFSKTVSDPVHFSRCHNCTLGNGQQLGVAYGTALQRFFTTEQKKI